MAVSRFRFTYLVTFAHGASIAMAVRTPVARSDPTMAAGGSGKYDEDNSVDNDDDDVGVNDGNAVDGEADNESNSDGAINDDDNDGNDESCGDDDDDDAVEVDSVGSSASFCAVSQNLIQ